MSTPTRSTAARLPLNDYVLRPDFDLQGAKVIEASAGTGKTYQIQTLYLRLIVEQGLDVRSVLVVTFTEAATKELRDRLRAILYTCRRHLDQPLSSDDSPDADRVAAVCDLPVQNNATGMEADALRRRRLDRALLDFDAAAIFTIHGFCKRVLDRFAFETGSDFGLELETDDSLLLAETCQDWWRRHMYPTAGTYDLLRLDPAFGVAQLTSQLSTCEGRPLATLLPPPLSAEAADSALSAGLDALAANCRELLAMPVFDAERFRPNAAAGRLAVAAREFAADDAAAPRERLDLAVALLDQQKKTPFKFTPLEDWPIPPPLQAMVDAADALYAEFGSRAKASDWSADGWLRHQAVPDSQADDLLANLLATAPAAVAAYRRLLDEPDAYPMKSTKGAMAVRELLESWDAVAADRTAQPAADFIKPLKELAKLPIRDRAAQDQSDRIVATLGVDASTLLAPIRAMLTGVIAELRLDFRRRKRERRTLSFSDLLINLHAALADDRLRPALLQALHREYRAGLIDEFQDTDPVQYDIFRQILVDAGLPTFLVGDPKQAIYGFRSGDIFTYYDATRRVTTDRDADAGPSLFSLDRNYRSETAMVGAVNALFLDRPEADYHGFISPEIGFDGSLKAQGKKPGSSLTAPPDSAPDAPPTLDPAPLKLWYYEQEDLVGGNSAPGKDSPFARRLYADTAEEIARLLNDPLTTIGGRRVAPSDIAVLILRHAEGEAISRELADRGVPAVRQKTGNVFRSREAADMQLLLLAMVEPSDLTNVRSALCTGLFGIDDLRLLALQLGRTIPTANADSATPTLESYVDVFHEAGDRWRQRSFIEAFNLLDRRLELRRHAIAGDQGERRLTNLLQLAELAHQAAVEQRLGPEGLVHWLSAQMMATQREDTHEMRLETDADAVKIMTVFHSKGLQFPIVFVPTFCLTKPKLSVFETSARFHPITVDPAAPPDAPLQVDMTMAPAHVEAAVAEQLQEQIRQLYVAVTRAVNRTYLAWGDIPIAPGVLDHVLNRGALQADVAVSEMRQAGQQVRLLGDPPAADPDAPARGQIALRRRDEAKPAAPSRYQADQATGADTLRTAEERFGYEIAVPKDQGHASFTAIAPSGHGARHTTQLVFDEPDEPEAAAQVEAPRLTDIFAFPAGAKTGSCWHMIFELLDYRQLHPDAEEAARDAARAVMDQQLSLFRLGRGRNREDGERRRQAVWGMVQQALTTPLPARDGEPWRLCELSPADTRREFVFDFPMARRRVTQGEISSLLNSHWGEANPDATPAQRRFAEHLADQSQAWQAGVLPRGYLTGSIDLFLRRGGQYCLLDWKSNKRGGFAADFDQDSLIDEMATHSYFLQYLIYSVAAHQYLKAALPGAYDYDAAPDSEQAGFGGAYYLFVRAMDRETPARGVFYDRPSLALVEELSALLGAFEREVTA